MLVWFFLQFPFTSLLVSFTMPKMYRYKCCIVVDCGLHLKCSSYLSLNLAYSSSFSSVTIISPQLESCGYCCLNDSLLNEYLVVRRHEETGESYLRFLVYWGYRSVNRASFQSSPSLSQVATKTVSWLRI